MDYQIHPAVAEKLEHFVWNHLAEPLQSIVRRFEDLATVLAVEIKSHPQLTIGLQHLIEAKDAVVRAKVSELKAAGTPAGPNTPEPEVSGK